MTKLLSATGLAALGMACLVVVQTGSTPTTGAHTSTAGSASGWCTAGEIRAAGAPRTVSPAVCDTQGKIVRAGALSVSVPAPGLSVQADALMPAGHQELTVHTNPDGTITITQETPNSAPVRFGAATRQTATQQTAARSTATVAGGVCHDPGYDLAGYQMATRFDWYYNSVGAPASVARTAQAAISQATKVVSTGLNRCGLKATLRASNWYLGGTTRPPQVSANGSCTGNDNHNVTGWGTMDKKFLAVTCTYFDSSHHAVASDALINRAYSWFTTKPQGCTYSFDVLSVMVHERGHTFGLGHVDQHAHAAAVMTPAVMACDTSKRSLSYGDYLGLVKLYGLR